MRVSTGTSDVENLPGLIIQALQNPHPYQIFSWFVLVKATATDRLYER